MTRWQEYVAENFPRYTRIGTRFASHYALLYSFAGAQ